MGLHLIRDWKLKKAVDKLLDAFEPLSKEDADVKSIFTSKTFWFNIVTGALGIAQVVPLKPATQAVIVGVGNIVLRWFTDTPVSLTGN